MSDSRQRALVICPGRGSYTSAEQGYLRRPLADTSRTQLDEATAAVDEQRAVAGLPALGEIDGADRLAAAHQALGGQPQQWGGGAPATQGSHPLLEGLASLMSGAGGAQQPQQQSGLSSNLLAAVLG